jgi:hypothetical protein
VKPERWQLEDGEARAREHATFEIPPRAVRTKLKVDQIVKLLFGFYPAIDGCTAEKMWVQVLEVKPGPLYVGVLANEPVYMGNLLKMGSQVVFEPKHVIGIE